MCFVSSGNGEVVAGTGEQCPPFDEARCGDGRKATEAQLLGPKGQERERKRETENMFAEANMYSLLHFLQTRQGSYNSVKSSRIVCSSHGCILEAK